MAKSSLITIWTKQCLYVFQAIFNCNLTLKGINTMNYKSNNLKFIKPLSISGYARLYEFQDGIRKMEDFFIDLEVNLESVEIFANEYATVLYFEFDFEDFDVLTKRTNRFQLYRFLDEHFPVRSREIDWMFDEFIQQTLSGIFQNKESKKTVLKLALDDGNSVLNYPSHDFFCLSHDLMATKKVPELQALEV